LLIWISVILSGLAQIFLKIGMTNLRQATAKSGSGLFGTALALFGQTFVWLWGICFAAAMGLWIVGLQKVDLSYAYPLVSAGYVLVTVLAMIFLGEKVNKNRWIAIAVICAGVWLISAS
jgi:drug/metabolite transporter (DMT)-like permease